MAFDEALAERLRRMLPKAKEKRMFGGMGLMERGNLVAGVSHDDLIVRVPPEETARWLRAPGAHEMMPGRPMQGWVKVAAKAVAKESDLAAWVERSRKVVADLPAK
jgi:TfoX/Sxy family transcriptional regulator of competence genes